MNDPAVFDPTREPFADGIDPRVIGRALSPGNGRVDTTTGERFHPDVSQAPWPPRTRGPLPPAERLPPDLNIGTAHDETDAWAHEHNQATNMLEQLRTELTDVEIEVMKVRGRLRRDARRNPIERGRRTAEDITNEVDEKLADDPSFIRKLALEEAIDTQMGRLFRAKDNIARLDRFLWSIARTGEHRP